MSIWPKVSIITPSLNQGKFLENTIKSVIEQNYPNLEYFIFDGGSTDNSVEIIKKYSKSFPKIIKWESKKDGGQVEAINKGLKMATGEIVAYLNSDDSYLPNTLQKVASKFQANPNKVWLTGYYKILADHIPFRSLVSRYAGLCLSFYSKSLLLILNPIPQPSTFWRQSVIKKIGYFENKYELAFDYDYWQRLARISSPIIIKQLLSTYRVHSQSKSTTQFLKQFRETFEISRKYTSNPIFIALHWLHTYLLIIPCFLFIYLIARILRQP